MSDHPLYVWLTVLSGAVAILWRHTERLHRECRADRAELWKFLQVKKASVSRGKVRRAPKR